MFINAIGIVILVASILNIFLGLYVYASKRKSTMGILFLFFSFFSSYWIFTNFLIGIFPTLFWFRHSYAAAALFIPASLIWIIYLTDQKLRKFFSLVFVSLGIIIAFITAFTDLIINSAEGIGFGGAERVTFGPLFPLFSLFFLGIILYFTIKLIVTYFKATGIKKIQLKYVLFGVICYGILSSIVSFLLPLFRITILIPFDSPSSLFFVIFTSYAITRYRFLDVRLIIFRSISFGILIALITGMFAALSAGIGSYLEQVIGFRSDIVIGLIVALIVTATYQPSRKFIEATTSKFLYKKSYNPDKLLAKINEVTSSILNLDQLLKEISKNLVEAFQCEKFGVALLTKEKKLKVAYYEGMKSEVVQSLVNYKNIVSILKQELKQRPGIFVINEMKTQYETGEYQPVDPILLGALSQNDLALISPLYVKEALIGVIAVGTKKSGDLYTQQDINVLEIISGQAAIAIENARLYDELKELNKTLQQRVDAPTKDRRAANTQLREMDRMKSDFISIASHQLRTPLTVIKGYISMMHEGSFGRVPAKILDQLAKVYAANERLIGLVENLLDISRIESGRQEFKWEPVQVEQLAATVVDNLGHNAKSKKLKLMFQKPKQPLPVVIADASKLHEVMMNFVDNAIKYTKEGEIVVSVSPEPAGMVTFEVKDTGIGMTPEGMSQLFKKFSRAQGSFQMHTEGLGLGLFVAKMLLDVHHGVIGAESGGKGTGSRFFFSVPLKQPKEANGKPNEPVVRYLGKD